MTGPRRRRRRRPTAASDGGEDEDDADADGPHPPEADDGTAPRGGAARPTRSELAAELADTLFENAQDGLFVVDVDWDGDDAPEFRIARVNPAYEAHTGLPDDYLRGRTLRSAFGDEECAAILANYRRCVETRESQRYEERLSVPAAGTVRDTRIAPVVVDGVVERVVGATRDVTAAKRREAELERHNERLEEFASVVSHDLRNPLMVAHGSLELARRSGAAADFDRAEAALRRMGALVDDLLSLARQGKLVRTTRPIPLAPLVESVRDGLPDDLDLDVEVAVDDYRVEADEPRLRQLVENLLSNAARHGGDGVRVRVGRLADDAGFYVADDGPGIPTADRDRVFEHGFSTAGGGTGFGLSIVAAIADAHGWSVAATDGADGGARFEVVVAPAE